MDRLYLCSCWGAECPTTLRIPLLVPSYHPSTIIRKHSNSISVSESSKQATIQVFIPNSIQVFMDANNSDSNDSGDVRVRQLLQTPRAGATRYDNCHRHGNRPVVLGFLDGGDICRTQRIQWTRWLEVDVHVCPFGFI